MTEQSLTMPMQEKQQVGKTTVSKYSFGCKTRALCAVIRREFTIFVRYPSWVISVLIWPMLFPLPYIFSGKALAGPTQAGVSVFAQLTGTSNYAGYMALGTLLWMWMNMVLWSFGGHLRNEQVRGTLESNWLSPMPRIMLLVGAGISNWVQQAAVLAIGLLQFYLVLGIWIHSNPWLVILVFLLTGPIVYGLGLLFASLVIWAKEVNAMVFLVRGLIMIFCGMSFPLAVMPEWMQRVAECIPMTYAIRAFRKVYLSNVGIAAVQSDLIKMAISGGILLIFGGVAFYITERLVRQKGTLGVY